MVEPVRSTGVFPKVSRSLSSPDDLREIISDPSGWSNYQSAEAEPGIVQDLLNTMTGKQWASVFGSLEQVAADVGTTEITLNKLGLISKQKIRRVMEA